MSEKICFDPTAYRPQALVCEAAPLAVPADASPVSSPREAPQALPLPSGSPLHHGLLANRRTLARQAFPEAPRARAIWEESPLAFSAFSMLPVACSSHPTDAPEDEPTGDGGGSSTGDAGTPDAPAPAPAFIAQGSHSESPCGVGSMITDLDEDFGVCANYGTGNHHLFRWNPLAAGAATSIITLSFPPDQILALAGGDILITTHGTPGLSWVNPTDSVEGHYPFPASLPISGTTSSGRSVSAVVPTFPKGLVELNGDIFIATSNLDTTIGDYLPGTVLRYHPSTSTWQHLRTSGFNPTSMAEAGGRLLVVSSGAMDRNGTVTTPSVLDIFDPASGALLRTVPLGQNGAGLSGEMALSADQKTLVLGTADNSGRLVVVDLEDEVARQINLRSQLGSPARLFFSQIQVRPDGRYAFVSNFNDGRSYVVDLTTGTLTASGVVSDDDTADAVGLGDAWLRGGDLFLSKGSSILRLRYQ